MKRSIVLAALTAMSILLPGPAGIVRAEDPESKEALAVRQLNAQEVLALLGGDRKALKKLWHDEFRVTNPFNRFLDGEQVLEMIEDKELAFTSLDRKIEYIRVYDDAAVVAGTETAVWAGKNPMAGKTSTVRFTSVWIEKGDTWEQVARHASMVASP